MGKMICVTLFTFVVFIGDVANANCINAIGRSEGTSNYTSTPVCTPGSGNVGAFIPGQGPGYAATSVGLSPEKRAEINKKIAEDQAAYCKANNYPTNVPFCAGYKRLEEAKQRCEDAKNHIPIEQNECKADADTFGTNLSIAYCGSDKASGIFGHEFNYLGEYYKSRTAYPPTAYSTGTECKQLAAAAIRRYQSYCTTNGDQQKLAACAGQ